MRVIFDIGTNNGDSTLHLLNEDSIIYAFEPTPCAQEYNIHFKR